MNSDLKFKDRLSAQAKESLTLNAFRVFADWFYRSLQSGLIGLIFTSYTREEECFGKSLSGFGARRRKGRDTLLKRFRRRAAVGFDGSYILGHFDAAARYLLESSLRMYGAFGIIFGIYTMLMFVIKAYALRLDPDVNYLIIGGIAALISLPMLYVRRPLIQLLQESRISRAVLYSVLTLKQSNLPPAQHKSGAKYNAAVITGMVVGFMTYFVDPAKIIAVIAAAVICAVIFYKPEAGIIGLIISAPFLSFAPRPTLLLSLGAAVTTVSYLIKYLRGKRTQRSGFGGFFILLFAGVILFGGMVSAGGGGSLGSALVLCILLLGYFLTVNLIRTRESCRHTLIALAVSMALSSLYGIAQYKFGNITANWLDVEMFSYIPGRATSIFDNPNVLGIYIIMFLPALFALFATTRGFVGRFLLAFSALCALLCLVWTWSRGAWLGFIFGAILYFVIISRKSLAALMVTGLTLPLAGAFLPSDIAGRFMSIGNLSDSSTYYRVYTWRGVLRMIRESWPGGIGVGQTAFEALYPAFAYAGTEASPHAHNLTMQITAETGIAGIVIFSIVIFLFAQNCFEFIGSSRGGDRHIVAAGLCGILSALFMGMFDYIWYNYRIFFLFWALMALTNSYIAASRGERAGLYEKMSPDTAELTLYNL